MACSTALYVAGHTWTLLMYQMTETEHPLLPLPTLSDKSTHNRLILLPN